MEFIGLLLFPVKSRCKPKSFTSDDILCGDRQSSLLNKEEVRKLASCSLITSYQFASNVSRSHKLMISGLNSKLLTEYDGNMQVEVSTKKDYAYRNAFLLPYPLHNRPGSRPESWGNDSFRCNKIYRQKTKFLKAGTKLKLESKISVLKWYPFKNIGYVGLYSVSSNASSSSLSLGVKASLTCLKVHCVETILNIPRTRFFVFNV